MKILLIVIDGLGDAKIPQLKNKTPLEAAKTPNLDFLAKQGICGLVEPFLLLPRQEKPESDTCHLTLFGYESQKYYLGRGVYEAAGIGIKLQKGDLALRVNFATVSDNLKVIDRRAGRISETQSLIKSLSGIEIEGMKFILKKSYGHRAVLILRCSKWNIEQRLSAEISDSDPKKEGEKVKKVIPLSKIKEAEFTAKVLNQFLTEAHQILKSHPLNKKRENKNLPPANYLLVRGAGILRKTPNFKEKYHLKACCIAGGALYKGIAKILGMDIIKVKGATGFPNTNLKEKFSAAKEALKKYNFIFLHIKAADSLAEDGDFLGKKEFIEKIDENLKPILNLKNILITVTSDHSTCSLLKRHCSEPIPILIYGDGQDSVKEFSERACKRGRLGEMKQLNLMPTILALAKK